MVIDAHNHLQDEWLAPHRETVLAALQGIGLGAAVVNGTEEADWPSVAALADGHPWVVPSYGLHPWFCARRSAQWLDTLRSRLDNESARGRPHAIGEIGLDRWKKPLDFADQQDVFLAQLGLAVERSLPVTIHCLNAWGALHEVMQRHPVPARGFLLHAYSGPAEMVDRWTGIGAYFSFNGYFLHDGKEARRDVFRRVPADRLLIETDAPAMPPPAWLTRFSLPAAPDGTPINHPASVADVYPALAALRGVRVDDLKGALAANFHRLFGGGNQLPRVGVPCHR